VRTLLLCFYLLATSLSSFAGTGLTLFGRGLYPGNDTTFKNIKESGFTTVILSSFYIHANGDVYSGDDNASPIIHNGRYVGNKEWLKRVAALKQSPSSVTRIEILLEGRWINQPPNTYDFIRDWWNETKAVAGITTGTGVNSTLYNIARVLKEEIGADAVCIDDESVYNSESITRLGEMLNKLHLHMSLCPYTNYKYWKDIITGSQNGLIDAVYVQCYDGGRNNAPGWWKNNLNINIPVYPVFLCRGAFSTCAANHNSKTPGEIKAEMVRFKKDYPGITGGGIWQMADVISYISQNCAVQLPESGSARSVPQYLSQLKNSLKEGLEE
jgi:hypothetical protein